MQIFEGMIRSFAFTTQGRLHTKDLDIFLMPTLLADTNLFLWVDLEKPAPEESQTVLEQIFHFHPLSIEDCVAVSASPKVEEYTRSIRNQRTELLPGEELSGDVSRTVIKECAID